MLAVSLFLPRGKDYAPHLVITLYSDKLGRADVPPGIRSIVVQVDVESPDLSTIVRIAAALRNPDAHGVVKQSPVIFTLLLHHRRSVFLRSCARILQH